MGWLGGGWAGWVEDGLAGWRMGKAVLISAGSKGLS